MSERMNALIKNKSWIFRVKIVSGVEENLINVTPMAVFAEKMSFLLSHVLMELILLL